MEQEVYVAGGTLLAAWPDMLDANFMHSVVLICQHSSSGAFGLVLNRLTEHVVSDLLPEHELLGQARFPIHLGGPVDHTAMQFVHSVPEQIPGGVAISDDLWLGGDLDAMARWITEAPSKARQTLRIFLGYSGWGAAQLDGELESGSWIPAATELKWVFGPAGEDTWRGVVRSIGTDGEELQNLPPDISWN